MSWGKGHGDATEISATSRGPASARPGHPARGRSTCRGRSPGSRVVAFVGLPGILPVALIDVGSPLTVAGAAPALSRSQDRSAPASLLAPGRNGPKDLDSKDYGRWPISSQDKYKDIFISLYSGTLVYSLKHEGDPVPPHYSRRAQVSSGTRSHRALLRMSRNGRARDHAAAVATGAAKEIVTWLDANASWRLT